MQVVASASTKVLSRWAMEGWFKEGEKAEARTWTQRSGSTPATYPIHLFIHSRNIYGALREQTHHFLLERFFCCPVTPRPHPNPPGSLPQIQLCPSGSQTPALPKQ